MDYKVGDRLTVAEGKTSVFLENGTQPYLQVVQVDGPDVRMFNGVYSTWFTCECLDQNFVPYQEPKVIVPKFVGDRIRFCEENYKNTMLVGVLGCANVFDWVNGNQTNSHTLIKAVFEGFEVEPESFKIGDWVVHTEKGTIHLLPSAHRLRSIRESGKYRLATEKEIKKHKQERFWRKLDRRVDEYHVGDLIHYDYSFYEVTRTIDGGCVVFGGKNGEFYIHFEKLRLVTPVEQRLYQ